MKTLAKLFSALLAATLVGCAALTEAFEQDEKVPLGDVPEAVQAAARTAVPGLQLVEAERETRDGQVVFELEGTVDGRKCEVHVAADGQVLRVRRRGGGS